MKRSIFVLLAILIFSCDPGEVTNEYDAFGEYIVSGSIVDIETLEGIPNFGVDMAGYKTLADGNGNYQISITNSAITGMITIRFQDQDGSMNGYYSAIEKEVDFTDIEFENGDGKLYFGQKVINLDIQLRSN